MKAGLFQLISDGDQVSAMRVAFLLVVAAFTIVWTVISLRRNEFAPIDWTQAAIVITAFAGKAHQARSENLSAPTP